MCMHLYLYLYEPAIAPNGLKSKGSKVQGGFGFMFAAADGQIH